MQALDEIVDDWFNFELFCLNNSCCHGVLRLYQHFIMCSHVRHPGYIIRGPQLHITTHPTYRYTEKCQGVSGRQVTLVPKWQGHRNSKVCKELHALDFRVQHQRCKSLELSRISLCSVQERGSGLRLQALDEIVDN